LSLKRAVANQGRSLEHNVLTVAAKGKGIKDAYILDAWRNSSELYWVMTSEDPNYDWVKYYPINHKVNVEQTAGGDVSSEKVN
jgi:predicted transglutaminase-like cysteine proteinase